MGEVKQLKAYRCRDCGGNAIKGVSDVRVHDGASVVQLVQPNERVCLGCFESIRTEYEQKLSLRWNEIKEGQGNGK